MRMIYFSHAHETECYGCVSQVLNKFESEILEHIPDPSQRRECVAGSLLLYFDLLNYAGECYSG